MPVVPVEKFDRTSVKQEVSIDTRTVDVADTDPAELFL